MENYLLCGAVSNSASFACLPSEESSSSGSSAKVTLYKGRKRGTVEFVGIWKHDRAMKDLVANGVKFLHKLNHENIMRFCEWYETSKHVWVITELTSGGTMAQILEQDRCIPPSRMADFFKDISSGLSYLHSIEVLYCDLQPTKIVLDTCENLKLCDFTLARTTEHKDCPHWPDFRSAVRDWFTMCHQSQDVERNDSQQTDKKGRTSMIGVRLADRIPCPFYAAPELYQGSGYSKSGDMWSLGCVAFEMLAGRQPFSHLTSAESLESVVCQKQNSELEMIGVDGEEDEHLEMWSSVVRGLLAKSPSQRYSWDRLNQVLGNTLLSIHR